MRTTKLFTALLFATFLGSALALNGKGSSSQDDDDDDSALETFIDVINGVMAIVNIFAFIFENGAEEAFCRFCAVLIVMTAVMAIGMVLAACCGIDATPRTRRERNYGRAIGLAANLSLADRNMRAYRAY